MKFRYLTKREEEQAIIKIMDILLDNSIPFSGKHRHDQWEKGWAKNLKSGDVKPGYFDKYLIQRLNGRFVLGLSPDYERQMLYTLVDKLAKKYFGKVDWVYEYGCGTGHNLLRVQAIYPNVKLAGFDWSASAVKLVKKLGFTPSCEFDFFNPPPVAARDEFNSYGVYTVAALEQTGTNYKKFVSHLLKLKPDVVVNIEPMPEYLDPTKLLDYLSIKYMEKRKYLSGYPDYIRELEKKGKVKILESRRSGIGSFLIDGYSVLVWKPL